MPAAGRTLLGFVTWDRDEPTGGNVYNLAISAELRALGIDVRLQQLAGPWPDGDASTHFTLARALRATPACLVDGIVAGGSPDVVAAAVESGHVITIVVHLPISDELGLDPRDASGTRSWSRERCTPRRECCARAAGPLPNWTSVRSGRCRRSSARCHARRRAHGAVWIPDLPRFLSLAIADADQGSAHAGTRIGAARGPFLDSGPDRLRRS